MLHPTVFVLSQVLFLIPALLIAAALVWPRPKTPVARTTDAFDRRIITLLAFGPAATTIALSALSGRGAIAMWGYPLWLFLGLWIVIETPRGLDAARLRRVAATWVLVSAAFSLAFAANYPILPVIDHRYRAVFYPGAHLADELARRFRAATGQPLVYVIGSMWDGGNVAHYAPEHPPRPDRRQSWARTLDRSRRPAEQGRRGGVRTAGDPAVMPVGLRRLAGDAQVQPPFELPYRRGDHILTVGWAILRPQPAFAGYSR